VKKPVKYKQLAAEAARRASEATEPENLSIAHIDEIIENEWLGLGDPYLIETPNLFVREEVEDRENPHIHLLKLFRNPDNFALTAKYLLNKTLYPFQLAILWELWVRPFPMLIGTRGMSKTFLLSCYSMLRAILCPGAKIIVVGNGFRQSKLIIEHCEQIWRSSPILRDLCGAAADKDQGPKHHTDYYRLNVGDSVIMGIPIGSGDKIRGLRANILIADEFASMNPEIFETVIGGFTSVSLDPVEKARSAAKRRARQRLGIDPGGDLAPPAVPGLNTNQTILSGTAYYGFNHFYDYWNKWHSIICSKGNPDELEKIFGGPPSPKFDYRDYCIMRIPYDLLPPDYMDEKSVARQKATIHSAKFDMEYNAVFSIDSDGFFKRSLIESCVVGRPQHPIVHASCGEVHFSATMRGHPNKDYVMAVDPASEHDNFAIVILELHPDHRRIVYSWTTKRKKFWEKFKRGLVQDDEFYGFAARKIRDLHKLFPCVRIGIDTQGGGFAVMERLRSALALREGERPILPVPDPKHPIDLDNVPGEKILVPITFGRAEWTAYANHSLKKDLEEKTLLFPAIDSVELGLATIQDQNEERVHDTLEDCITDIEEMKDEMATIVMSEVQTRERWDTPAIKAPGAKKGRYRKDRYSALLMANTVARDLQAEPKEPKYSVEGGPAHYLANLDKAKQALLTWHQNPVWYDRVVLSEDYGISC